MPTVLRVGGFSFSFFAADGSEPPHVHVQRGRGDAKYWLTPIRLAKTKGFSKHELGLIAKHIKKHHTYLLEHWNGFFPGA